jgi:hypothetical protein
MFRWRKLNQCYTVGVADTKNVINFDLSKDRAMKAYRDIVIKLHMFQSLVCGRRDCCDHLTIDSLERKYDGSESGLSMAVKGKIPTSDRNLTLEA